MYKNEEKSWFLINSKKEYLLKNGKFGNQRMSAETFTYSKGTEKQTELETEGVNVLLHGINSTL